MEVYVDIGVKLVPDVYKDPNNEPINVKINIETQEVLEVV